MRLKSFLSPILLTTLSTGLLVAQTASKLAGLSSTFAVTHNTQIPGATLQPGQYTIHVVDSFDDRAVVQIDGTTVKEHTIFLGIPGSSRLAAGGQGIVSWGNGVDHTPTLRGFAFGAGPVVEFVYPKPEAAQLAKLNSASEVVAVDYQSSHLKSMTGLSDDEMRVINLWLLSVTHTGPESKTPAILAKRYEGPALSPLPVVARSTVPQRPAPAPTPLQKVKPQSVPVQTARLEPLPRPIAPRAVVAPPARRAAPARQAPLMAALPHTASDLPMIALIGLLSLLAAVAVRFTMRSSSGTEAV